MNTQPLVIFVGRAYPRKIINPNCQVQVIGFVLFMYKLFHNQVSRYDHLKNYWCLSTRLCFVWYKAELGRDWKILLKKVNLLAYLGGGICFLRFFFFMTSSPTTSSPFQLTIEVKVFSSYCLGRLSLGRGVYIQEYAGSAMNIGIER